MNNIEKLNRKVDDINDSIKLLQDLYENKVRDLNLKLDFIIEKLK